MTPQCAQGVRKQPGRPAPRRRWSPGRPAGRPRGTPAARGCPGPPSARRPAPARPVCRSTPPEAAPARPHRGRPPDRPDAPPPAARAATSAGPAPAPSGTGDSRSRSAERGRRDPHQRLRHRPERPPAGHRVPMCDQRAGVSHTPGQLFEQRRLAATRTSGHQDDAARPVVTCSEQPRQFVAATDKRRTHLGSIACAGGTLVLEHHSRKAAPCPTRAWRRGTWRTSTR